MSSRERWTIYPLLFLALGIALKDKLSRTVTTDTLVCEKVLVVDRDQDPMLELLSTSGGGVLKTFASDQSVIISLGNYPQFSGLVIAEPNGRLLPNTMLVRRHRSPQGTPRKSDSPDDKAGSEKLGTEKETDPTKADAQSHPTEGAADKP